MGDTLSCSPGRETPLTIWTQGPSAPWRSLTPRPQDHDTELTCLVTLPGVWMTLENQLNISYAPQLVTTRISQESFTDLNGTSLPILEGQFPRLVCVADGNAPATLSWLWEGKPPSPSQRSAPGVLEIAPVGVGDGGEVTCRAQHPLGSQQVSFSLSVQSVAATRELG